MLLMAAHETTAKMLTDLCVVLACYPDVLQQARAEQDQFAGPLALEQFRQMPYLDRVLKEVERCFPPTRNGFRMVMKPFEFGGYTIPAGWRVIYRPVETHRDPEVFPDPERFDPERFSPGRIEHYPPFSLVGFGGGPRACIGRTFAYQEIRVIAAHLLREYEWSFDDMDRLRSERAFTRKYLNMHGSLRPRSVAA
jgi:cytochrome P450